MTLRSATQARQGLTPCQTVARQAHAPPRLLPRKGYLRKLQALASSGTTLRLQPGMQVDHYYAQRDSTFQIPILSAHVLTFHLVRNPE